MLIAYDGTPFHGFAEQRDVRTVGGELRIALERIFNQSLELICAGRTDTGVHAWGQVVHFDVERDDIEVQNIQRSLNKQLGPAIVVREVSVVPYDFHARFSATGRRYNYSVLNTDLPNPFIANTSWWVSNALDVDSMNRAAAAIIGEHDFSTFCRRPKSEEEVSLTRRINAAKWSRNEDLIEFDIEANAFCHQMVRSLTGMLVEIGRGRRSADDMSVALEARDRSKGAPLAPPQGLCLREVFY